MPERISPDEIAELQHQWNRVLARDNLSTRRGEKLPKRPRHATQLLHQKYIEHPTAQYTMSFRQFKKAKRNNAQKKF